MDSMPQRRIGKVTGWLLIGFFAAIDLIQIALDAMGIGLIANNFIDIAVAFILFMILFMKGVPIVSDFRIFFALFVTLAGENLPIPGLELAPFWSLDMAYIVRLINKQDTRRIQEAEAVIAAEALRLEQQKIIRAQLNQQDDWRKAA
jgi:hypothetical protein